ncbi:MAG: TonB-dependent receptor [Ignavibacteria bacterium]|nr:TonB-dependent receptor [Ignavibacteria bacterium]
MRDNIFTKIISLLIFALLCFFSIDAMSQSTGSIGGDVVDITNGVPLEGATIKIVGSNMGAISDAGGEFVILNVDVGTYDLEVTYIGYDKKMITGVKVSVDMRTKVKFELSVTGEIKTDVIVIEAERKGIDVEQSGRIIESQSITNTGIRGITNIVAKTAGVVQDERGGNLNIRGGRTNENIIIVDGVETTNPIDGTSRASIPNNLLSEITVLTGGFGAEYGNVLSGVINVSTRSGTDRYTGSLEVITDEFMGKKSQGYNLYNMTIGGPVIPTKELARVFNFFGSFERTFERMTVGSWIIDKYTKNLLSVYNSGVIANNLPKSVDSLGFSEGKVKDNESGRYSINARLNINLTEIQNSKVPVNLRLGGTYTYTKGRILYGGNVLMNSYRNPVTKANDQQYFARVSVNPSSKFFFELQGNYFKTITEQFDPVFEDKLYLYGDTAANPKLAAYGRGPGLTLPYDPKTSYLFYPRDKVIDYYQKYDISYLGGKLDATWALLSKKFGDHEIKFGGELKYHTLKKISVYPASIADLTISSTYNRYYGTNLARLKTYGFTIYDPLTGDLVADQSNIDAGTAPKHPITGGFYIRDKVSFSDFNFNGGLRVDFLDVNDDVFKDLMHDITGPDGVVASPDDFVKSKVDVTVSPRLGFSFPITDKIIFIAQYGKMVQMPQLNLLYVNKATLREFLSTSLQDVIENSSLKPTKLTQYEIGFKQQVGDYINLGITAFYKESVDLIGAGRIKATPDGKVPVGFAAYQNLDYAISKGLDFYFSMRRWNRISIDAAYTLSYATGTGSDPYSKNSLANDATQELPYFVYPLDYDQRHTGNINLDYRFGDDDVPQGVLGDVLKNLGLNVLFSFNSGRPYTARDASYTWNGYGGDIIYSSKNEVYTKWNFRLDLRLDKTVRIWKTNWNFYFYVINALNTEIVNDIFEGTGKPDDNGYTTTPTGASKFVTDPVFRALWPERIKYFGNWGPPRQVRFGVNVSF